MARHSAGREVVNYDAPPTVQRFMLDDHEQRFILGPVGSGKTTGVMFELLRRAAQQHPAPDGKRYTRFAITRNTLSQMKQTVLQDVKYWLGSVAHWKVSESAIEIRSDDIHSDWYLIPLDDPESTRRLLSLQLTGAWLNEFIEMDPEIIPPLAGRTGRFPSAALGGCSWFGIVGDSNMPNIGSRWHELLEVTRPTNWGVFIQPGGMSNAAENLNWLRQTPDTLKLPMDHPVRLRQGRSYYESLLLQHSSGWIKRYVHAEYGDDPDGTAVFRGSFNPDFHVSKKPLESFTGFPIIIGQDFGLSPCSLIAQMTPTGQVRILREVVAERVGLELHMMQNMRPVLTSDERFIGKRIFFVADPAGMAQNQLIETNNFAYLESLGFAAYPAPTNDIEPRLNAVEQLLVANVRGQPLLLIDGPNCPTLVQALHTRYMFAKRKDGELRPKPEKKHPWSDLADALQYIAMFVQDSLQAEVAQDQSSRQGVRSREMGGRARTASP